jgi:hypothetical protein
MGSEAGMIEFDLTPSNRQFLVSKLERLDPHVIWHVSIRKKKSKRSLDQNRRLWDLYGAIGDYIGEDKYSIHELMGYKFLRELKTVGGETVEVIKSTTNLSTKDMADYQDAIERWAAEIGFIWEEAA